MENKEYYVTLKIDARYVAKVNAASIDEAKKKAIESYENADFGEAADIDGEVIIVEDEDGEYVWKK